MQNLYEEYRRDGVRTHLRKQTEDRGRTLSILRGQSEHMRYDKQAPERYADMVRDDAGYKLRMPQISLCRM